jgi:hypothetical protein
LLARIRDRLAPFAGVQDERHRRVCVAYSGEKLDTVLFGHLVVAHDTVELLRPKSIEPLTSARRRLDGERGILRGEHLGRQVPDGWIVVDVKHCDPRRLRHTSQPV